MSDHTGVDPRLGTLADLDDLVGAAHARGLRVLLDLVPCHTSIEHPWFRELPERYVWADGGPPNNWRASFGGPAWDRDPLTGRWYLHSFFPEQPDLDWRNPAVPAAMAEVIRFWLARGVDGFRLDAIDRLMKDPLLRDDPPARAPFPLPLVGAYAELEHLNSTDAPDIGQALAALREAAGDAFLVGEAYLPTASLGPYLDHLDAAFAFELMHAPWDARRLRRAIAEGCAVGRLAWVTSNHDFRRLASRWGRANARAAALLLLGLPGPAFVYQGDEIGAEDGPGADPPRDRAGRDPYRRPMRWEPGPGGGFTSGVPWLPLDEAGPCVAEQDGDPGSVLSLYRELIALRRDLGEGLELLDADPDLIAFRRGGHLVVVNAGADRLPLPGGGEVLLATDADALTRRGLAPGGGVVAAGSG